MENSDTQIFSYKVTSRVGRIVTVKAHDKNEADHLILEAIDGKRPSDVILGTFAEMNDRDCSFPVLIGKDSKAECLPGVTSNPDRPDIVAPEPFKGRKEP